MNVIRLHPSEKEFQEAVVTLARLKGWRCYHTHDSRRSQPGFPDLTLARRPRLVFIELKVGRNKATQDQHDWLDELGHSGAETHIFTPDDWDHIARILK